MAELIWANAGGKGERAVVARHRGCVFVITKFLDSGNVVLNIDSELLGSADIADAQRIAQRVADAIKGGE